MTPLVEIDRDRRGIILNLPPGWEDKAERLGAHLAGRFAYESLDAHCLAAMNEEAQRWLEGERNAD